MIFPTAEKKNNEKKKINLIIMKNEKQFWCRKCGLGYYPTVLQGLEVLYCENKNFCIAKIALYCNREKLGWKILCCNAGNSKLGIVLQEAWLQRDCIAIQKLYCD